MKISVAGADTRFVLLTEKLLRAGYDATMLEENAGEPGDVLIGKYPLPSWLVNMAFARYILLATREVAEEFCRTHAVTEVTRQEDFLQKNAALTAEGAIFSAMKRLPHAICDLEAAIIGYGRIGQALTGRLLALGAQVTVISRRAGGCNSARQQGARAVGMDELAEVLHTSRLIFVTSPGRQIENGALLTLRPDALLIDLSGEPHGVDVDCAEAAGKNIVRESGLPGRYCPESAAEVLFAAVVQALKEEGAE